MDASNCIGRVEICTSLGIKSTKSHLSLNRTVFRSRKRIHTMIFSLFRYWCYADRQQYAPIADADLTEDAKMRQGPFLLRAANADNASTSIAMVPRLQLVRRTSQLRVPSESLTATVASAHLREGFPQWWLCSASRSERSFQCAFVGLSAV